MLNGSMPADCAHVTAYSAEYGHADAEPHNIQAERGLIGAILIDNKTFEMIAGLLTADVFYEPLHSRIFDAAATFIGEGRVADPITLSPVFAGEPPLPSGRSVSGYLGSLVSEACIAASAPNYARELVALWERRQIIAVCEATSLEARDASPGLPPSAIAAAGAWALGALEMRGEPDIPFVSQCLADVNPTPIGWLWPERIALGKLSLIAGAPGVGKSQLTCAMTAAVTRGGAWPDGTRAPLGAAVFITCEDDAADTIRPRLDAAGADVALVHQLDWVLASSRERKHFSLRDHIPQLTSLIRHIGNVKLVVIDPVTAYLGRTDSHVAAEVREVLRPLQFLAAGSGAAFLLVTHLNKCGSERNAMNRVTGSGAFVAVCRSSWLVGIDPQDPSKRRRVFAPLKNNIGDDRTGFAYTIESSAIGQIRSSRIMFDPTPVEVAADDLLHPPANSSEDVRGCLLEAIEFLKVELADGPKPATRVKVAAAEAGVSGRTLRRAREHICNVRKNQSEWVWSLKTPNENG